MCGLYKQVSGECEGVGAGLWWRGREREGVLVDGILLSYVLVGGILCTRTTNVNLCCLTVVILRCKFLKIPN